MESPKLNNIKKELQQKSREELILCCLRMAKYKVENKELLHYLLFDDLDRSSFKDEIKTWLQDEFAQLPSSEYRAVKMLRKIWRQLNKYIKFMASKADEAEVLLFFSELFIRSRFVRSTYGPLINLFYRQLEKVQKIIPKLHEDLQFDVQQDYESLLLSLKEKKGKG